MSDPCGLTATLHASTYGSADVCLNSCLINEQLYYGSTGIVLQFVNEIQKRMQVCLSELQESLGSVLIVKSAETTGGSV